MLGLLLECHKGQIGAFMKNSIKIEKLSTQKEFDKLEIQDKDYSRGVKGCPRLSLRVRSNGTKEWRYTYTHPITKSKAAPTIAVYDNCLLMQAIDIATALSDLLKKGITPESAIKTKLVQLPQSKDDKNKIVSRAAPQTFSDLANLWVEYKLAGDKIYSTSTVSYWHRNIKYLNYYFGDTPPQSVNTQMIHTACEESQRTNGKKVGLHMRSYCESILKFGKIRGWLTTNEAIDTRGELLSLGSPRNHPALLEKRDIGRLLCAIEDLEKTRTNPNTILALTLLPHLFVRSADIRSMRWDDIDFEKRRWVFSPQKGIANEKMVDSLIVPLSSFVIEKLLNQKLVTGGSDYVFASKGNTKNMFISRNVLNSAIERLGFKGKQSPHGFRATAKTVAMEAPELGFSDIVIELQLGHKIKDIHGNAYNRVEFLEKRIELMEKLSEWLINAKQEYKKTLDESASNAFVD